MDINKLLNKYINGREDYSSLQMVTDNLCRFSLFQEWSSPTPVQVSVGYT